MSKSIDEIIPGEWGRCETCGLYDPEDISNHKNMMEQIAREGVESLLDNVSLNPQSLMKLRDSLQAHKEISEGQYCSCAFPHAINRYRLFDRDNKYIRVTASK